MESSDELSILEGYARWAACYDDDGNPLVALEGPAIKALIGPVAGRPVLDLGCGTGRHTATLADGGARVTALDQSQEMMKLAKRRLDGREVDWRLHSLPEPLPFADQSFELVVLGLVAEHLGELTPVLREVSRVLRPGGRCLLSALHPDRTATGQRARFIDPTTGLRQPIATFHRTVEEYLAAASGLGFQLETQATLKVPAELASRLPRAAPYVGLSLGWVASWKKD